MEEQLRQGDERRTEVSAGFFAPERTEGVYLSFGGRVTWPRLLLRAVVFVAALLLVDAAVGTSLPPPAVYGRDYRLPRNLPTASLPAYASAIDAAGQSSAAGPVVLFLGASPTWGHRIAESRDTFPYAFRSAAASSGVQLRSFNLACNGQFTGDEYVIARRLADDADVVFVELTYHTFNPKARSGRVIRYAELPRLLGVQLAPRDSRLLGLESRNAPGPLSAAEASLGRRWLLWRERDALDRRLVGGRPRDSLATAVERTLGTKKRSGAESAIETADAVDDGFAAFDALDPARQMTVIARYAESSSFEISRGDPEVVLLGRLAGMLAAKGKKAVFYMTPLNRRLLEEYELIDAKQYARNVRVLRDAVETSGFDLLDYNVGPDVVPARDFADISHTTDAGGRMVGALLFRDTAGYLGEQAR